MDEKKFHTREFQLKDIGRKQNFISYIKYIKHI